MLTECIVLLSKALNILVDFEGDILNMFEKFLHGLVPQIYHAARKWNQEGHWRPCTSICDSHALHRELPSCVVWSDSLHVFLKLVPAAGIWSKIPSLMQAMWMFCNYYRENHRVKSTIVVAVSAEQRVYQLGSNCFQYDGSSSIQDNYWFSFVDVLLFPSPFYCDESNLSMVKQYVSWMIPVSKFECSISKKANVKLVKDVRDRWSTTYIKKDWHVNVRIYLLGLPVSLLSCGSVRRKSRRWWWSTR